MVYQRVHKSSSWNPLSQEKSAPLAPRPFAVQAQLESHRQPNPTQEELENDSFHQNKREAFGLQPKQESSTITPVEQGRLGMVQAKMDASQTQRMERASQLGHNFADIDVHAPGNPVSMPVQPQLALQLDRDSAPQHALQQAIALANNRGMGLAQRAFQPGSFQPYQASPIQAKLTIGQPNDRYEQEADRVASQVVEQIHTAASPQTTQKPSVQRQEERDEELQAQPSFSNLQRSPLSSKVQREAIPEEEALQAQSIQRRGEAIAGGEASPDLASAIHQARGSGQPLDASLQQSMGQAMGADFSGVRVHTDAQSNQLNQSIQARAFTTRQDVFFRQGAYQPGVRDGQELIAHELTHVVQQNGGAVQRSLLPQPIDRVQRHPMPLIHQSLVGQNIISCGRKGKTTTASPSTTVVDPAIAAKEDVVRLRDEAIQKDTSAARAQEILNALSLEQPRIAQMSRTQHQMSAVATVDSAIDKISNAVNAKKEAEIQSQASQKEAAKIAKIQNQLPGAITALNKLLTELQTKLSEVMSAGSAAAVTEALKTVDEKQVKALDGRNKLANYIATWQGVLTTQKQNWSAINASHMVEYVAQTLREQQANAMKTIEDSIATAEETQAITLSLMPHVESAANHAKRIAEAKIDALQKSQEASTLQEEADKQLNAAKLAEEAAQKLEVRVQQATQEVQNTQALMTQAQQQLQSATLALTQAEARRQSLDNDIKAAYAVGAEPEPYMVEGLTEHAAQEEATARSNQAGANASFTSISEKKQQADTELETATQEHSLASQTAKEEQGKADLATHAAQEGHTQADAANVTTDERTHTAQQGLAVSQQELAELETLRSLAGGQIPLNALAVIVPSRDEQKALMEAVGYPLLMDCLKANISKATIQALGTAFGAGISGFSTTVEHPQIIALLGSFTPAEVKELHDQTNIGATKLKQLVICCTAPTLKTYRDTMTLATLNGYLAAFTPTALHTIVTKLTIAPLSLLSAQFTATELRDLAAAITDDKLLDLTTAYNAAEIKALTTNYGNVKLKELLSGMTAAEMKAYIAIIGQARLIEVMDTHQLKVGALKHYGAAWLRDWAGANDHTFNHLLALHINAGVVSGGHDLNTFCNRLNQVISAPGDPVVRQGSYVPNPPSDGDKVTYRIYDAAGNQLGVGSKTLFTGLAGRRVAMLAAVNGDIWAAIRRKAFSSADGAWTAGGYQGFHDGSQIATFYPT